MCVCVCGLTHHSLELIAGEEGEEGHGDHAGHALPHGCHLLIKLMEPAGNTQQHSSQREENIHMYNTHAHAHAHKYTFRILACTHVHSHTFAHTQNYLMHIASKILKSIPSSHFRK